MIKTVKSGGLRTLETDALRVVTELQRSLQVVLSGLPGPPTRPRDLVNRLGIHHSLAWKITRLASGADPMSNAQFIPGRAGMARFLESAVREGAAVGPVAAVREAFGRFRELVESHAGDRPSLDLMLGNLAPNRDTGADKPSLRRAAYLCNSATWGVQMRTRVLTKILHPSEPEGAGRAGGWDGLMDIALVRLFEGMRRVRADAPLVLSRAVTLDNDGKARRSPVAEGLDPAGGESRLLPGFCSDPAPTLYTTAGAEGIVEQRVRGGPVGEWGAVTLCTGEVQRRAASAFADAHNTASRTGVEVRIPMQQLVIDVWAHRSICPGATPRAWTYSEVSGAPWYRQSKELLQSLPMGETVQTLGWGLGAAALPGVQSYAAQMGYAFERLGWEPSEHVLHRLQIDFPVLATAVVLEMDLPIRA